MCIYIYIYIYICIYIYIYNFMAHNTQSLKYLQYLLSIKYLLLSQVHVLGF